MFQYWFLNFQTTSIFFSSKYKSVASTFHEKLFVFEFQITLVHVTEFDAEIEFDFTWKREETKLYFYFRDDQNNDLKRVRSSMWIVREFNRVCNYESFSYTRNRLLWKWSNGKALMLLKPLFQTR